MSTLNNTGTIFIGEYEWDEKSNYITNEYIVIMGIPILPVGSYRVIDSEVTENSLIGKKTNYKLIPIPLQWKYILPIILTVYITFILIIFLFWITFSTKNQLFQLLAIFGIIAAFAFGMAKLMTLK